MRRLRGSIILVVMLALCSAAHAQDRTTADQGFADFCKSNLQEDIQEDRQICVVGLVEDETHVQVFFATEPGLAGQNVEVFQSPMQQGHQEPLPELAENVGRIVVVGGFDNLPTIYSARLLSGSRRGG